MLIMTPILDVERASKSKFELSLHYFAICGVGDVSYDVSWVIVARHKITVLKIILLSHCIVIGGRSLEIEGPNITVLVISVLHSVCCLIGWSLLTDLQVDCFSIAYLVMQLELSSQYHRIILILYFKARHCFLLLLLIDRGWSYSLEQP